MTAPYFSAYTQMTRQIADAKTPAHSTGQDEHKNKHNTNTRSHNNDEQANKKPQKSHCKLPPNLQLFNAAHKNRHKL